MRLYSEETYSPGFRRQIGELGGGDSESASGNSENSTVLRERQERRETERQGVRPRLEERDRGDALGHRIWFHH